MLRTAFLLVSAASPVWCHFEPVTNFNTIWHDIDPKCALLKQQGKYPTGRDCSTVHDYVFMSGGKYLTTLPDADDSPLHMSSQFSDCARWKLIRSADLYNVGMQTPFSHLIYQDKSSGCGGSAAVDQMLQLTPNTVSGHYAVQVLEVLFYDQGDWRIVKKGSTTVQERTPVSCPDTYDKIVCDSRHTVWHLPADKVLGPCCMQITYTQSDTYHYMNTDGNFVNAVTSNPSRWVVEQVQ